LQSKDNTGPPKLDGNLPCDYWEKFDIFPAKKNWKGLMGEFYPGRGIAFYLFILTTYLVTSLGIINSVTDAMHAPVSHCIGPVLYCINWVMRGPRMEKIDAGYWYHIKPPMQCNVQ
jgi:hypothetical protein